MGVPEEPNGAELDALRNQLLTDLAGQAESDPLAALLVAQLSTPSPDRPLQSSGVDLQPLLLQVAEELRDCRGILDQLATALGACETCWGEEQECWMCRGRGGPGWRQPAEDEFRRWILPAVMMMTRRTRAPAHDHADPIPSRAQRTSEKD
jgi:hypothetical protein